MTFTAYREGDDMILIPNLGPHDLSKRTLELRKCPSCESFNFKRNVDCPENYWYCVDCSTCFDD